MAAFGSVFAFNNLIFLGALSKSDNSIVDITWSLSLLVPNYLGMYLTKSYRNPRVLLSNLLVTIWATRLSYHIGSRHQGKEDYRYAQWRKDWEKEGKSVAYQSWSFVFMLQAMFSCVNNVSALYITMNPSKRPLGRLDAMGVALWTTGFVFEALGDK